MERLGGRLSCITGLRWNDGEMGNYLSKPRTYEKTRGTGLYRGVIVTLKMVEKKGGTAGGTLALG